MARAETRTLLPLDRFARIMGVHPVHFNGVYLENIAPVTTCEQPLMQYDWQTADGVSRESIALAIADAEERISRWLGFKPLPTFEVDERHAFARPSNPTAFRWNLIQPNGMSEAVKLDFGHVVAGGIERRDAVETSAAVAYTDDDGDGYKETATIIINTTITDPNEIVVCLPGEGGAEEFEVRPITVAIANGAATVRMRREQLVIPSLYDQLTSTRAIDGANDANFLPVVDVYRSWHDPSQQVQFLWENGNSSCGCGGGDATCTSCYIGAQFGCSSVRDYRLGLISGTPATWDATTSAYAYTHYWVTRSPDKARWWYRAGYRDQQRPRPMRDMARRFERAISIMAASVLERPFCGCKTVEAATQYWREDFALLTQDHSFRVSSKLLDNPLGTTRGAVEAWRIIRAEALGDGI